MSSSQLTEARDRVRSFGGYNNRRKVWLQLQGMTSTMLHFDHCYTSDPKHRFLNKLKRLGFEEVAKPVQHPGGSYCRFITFRGGNPMGRMYLEFVHRAPEPCYRPGLSFGYTGDLQKLKSSRRINSKLIHRNYDWHKRPKRERRPGWNFLLFSKCKFRTIHFWITQYEPTAERNRRKRPAIKVNGVSGVSGFDLQLNKHGLKFLESLLQRKISNSVRLACGTTLWVRPGSVNRVRAVVMKTGNVRKWAKEVGVRDLVMFRNKTAARIANPTPRMWDLLFID